MVGGISPKRLDSSTAFLKSENSTVVAAVTSGLSRGASLMPLMSCMQCVKATFAFSLRARHLPGVLNVAADGLSRNRPLPEMRRLSPQMAPGMFRVPSEMWTLLEPSKISFPSQDWRARFRATLHLESPPPLAAPIAPARPSLPAIVGSWG